MSCCAWALAACCWPLLPQALPPASQCSSGPCSWMRHGRRPCGPPQGHRLKLAEARPPAALHQMFSRSAAIRRATIEVETTAGVFRQRTAKVQTIAGVSASARLKSSRSAALSFECYKRKMETVWLRNNSYGCKPILWHDTRFFYILRSHCWILRSHWWIGREHLYFPSGIGL